jgi:hypothetical protein
MEVETAGNLNIEPVLGDLMVFWSSRGSGVTGSWIIKLY